MPITHFIHPVPPLFFWGKNPNKPTKKNPLKNPTKTTHKTPPQNPPGLWTLLKVLVVKYIAHKRLLGTRSPCHYACPTWRSGLIVNTEVHKAHRKPNGK